METLHSISLYITLLIPVLLLGHPNDTVKQFKKRVAAQQVYQHGCESSRYYISDDGFIRCQACSLFKSMSEGNEILSKEKLKQNHLDACITYYAKQFQAPKDSEQLITFCSEAAENFVSRVRSLIKDM